MAACQAYMLFYLRTDCVDESGIVQPHRQLQQQHEQQQQQHEQQAQQGSEQLLQQQQHLAMFGSSAAGFQQAGQGGLILQQQLGQDMAQGQQLGQDLAQGQQLGQDPMLTC